jgi:anthranilate synthase component 1
VRLAALSANGRNLLDAVATALPDAVSERGPANLVLRFPPRDEVDAEARLLAPSPFDALRALTRGIKSLSPEEPFTLACLGIVSFDHVDSFETLPAPAEDPLDFPDFVFWIAETLIVFEPGGAARAVCTAFGARTIRDSASAYYAASQRLTALIERFERIGSARIEPPGGAAAPKAAEVDLDDAAYGLLVASLKENIAAGDVYQIVLSRTFRVPCPDPLGAFAALRRADPSPYLFFVSGERHVLFGASPETSVRVALEEGWPTVEVKPIAGTRPRGRDADEDDRLEAELRLDAKELAEHMMLVDLARNDVARISLKGKRRVAGLMSVERYARVMHLVSSVKGPLAPDHDAFHALQACLNVGTLSGAPKIRATELIRETEATKRGPYGGAVGWLNGDGELDSGVIIRSAVVKDDIAYVRAGAGIVHDSDPACEAEETRRKASAILSALAAAGGAR